MRPRVRRLTAGSSAALFTVGLLACGWLLTVPGAAATSSGAQSSGVTSTARQHPGADVVVGATAPDRITVADRSAGRGRGLGDGPLSHAVAISIAIAALVGLLLGCSFARRMPGGTRLSDSAPRGPPLFHLV